jgi:hypothetical protein
MKTAQLQDQTTVLTEQVRRALKNFEIAAKRVQDLEGTSAYQPFRQAYEELSKARSELGVAEHFLIHAAREG